MKRKRLAAAGLVFFLVMLATADIARAEINADVRVKLGSATGVDTMDFSNFPSSAVAEDGGGNFQVELVIAQKVDTGATLVGGAGIFGRTHKGNMNDLFFPATSVEYDAGGLSGTIGVGVIANPNLHFEGRLELDLGRGKPTLTTPFWPPYNPVQEGDYAAAALILGGYYTVSKPGLQLGFELGAQSFTGNFQIWNNAGFWNDAKAKGSGGFVNLVIGARF